MATSPLSSIGSVLQSVGQLLQAESQGGVGGPVQPAAAPQPAPAPVDQFAPGEPNPARPGCRGPPPRVGISSRNWWAAW